MKYSIEDIKSLFESFTDTLNKEDYYERHDSTYGFIADSANRFIEYISNQQALLIQPKEITIDSGNNYHTASFEYYDGLQYAKLKNLRQSTLFSEVWQYTHFIVCCGDVMVRVNPNDYPNIQRRTI